MIAKVKAQSFRCSFCGKANREVANMIAGTPPRISGSREQPSAFICDECVRRYYRMVAAADFSTRRLITTTRT